MPVVSNTALVTFQADFRAFVAAERLRLEQDKSFLQEIKVGEEETSIAELSDSLAAASGSELEQLLGGT